MSTGKVVIGVLTGVAIGTVLGMLVAPDKGSITRKKWIKKGSNLVGDSALHTKEFINKETKKFQPMDGK